MGTFKVGEVQQLAAQLGDLLSRLSDEDLASVATSNVLELVLRGIFDVSKKKPDEVIGEFLLNNRYRASFAMRLHYQSINAHLFRIVQDERVYYCSPVVNIPQQIDTVNFLEGEKPYEGFLGKYSRGGKCGYAIANRAIGPGEYADESAMDFISMDQLNEQLRKAGGMPKLEADFSEFKILLSNKETDEIKYQKWFEQNPWIFGAKYDLIENHKPLDNHNIPDFTGVRATDKDRDIFEIEQPFKRVLLTNGDFSSDFNHAWKQIEDYRAFAMDQRSYLLDKGIKILNPRSILIYGYDLPEKELDCLRKKARHNSHFDILTYNDVVALGERTIQFLKELLPRMKNEIKITLLKPEQGKSSP